MTCVGTPLTNFVRSEQFAEFFSAKTAKCSSATSSVSAGAAHDSKFENHSFAQHLGTQSTGTNLDLAHRHLTLPRFQVSNVNFGRSFQLTQFAGQQGRAEVAGERGQSPVAVSEGGFDDEVAQVGDGVHDRPEAVVDRRVAGEDEARGARIELVADRWDGVLGGQRGDFALAEVRRLADLDRLVAHDGPLAARNFAEIRPDRPVEDVLAQDRQCRFGGVNDQRPVAQVGDGVDHQRQGGDVVEVRVRDEDMVDGRQFGERQVGRAGAGVDQDVVVDQHRRGALVAPADAAAAAEDSDFHLLSTGVRAPPGLQAHAAKRPSGILPAPMRAKKELFPLANGKTAKREPRRKVQALRKNSILTPAISITSRSRSGWGWAPTGCPLTTGNCAPSTWVTT